MRCGYSRIHRTIEILGIVGFVTYAVYYGYVCVLVGGVSLPFVPLMLLLALISADFLSGAVHFLCDNYGSPDTPLLGPMFIKPFREHHDDARDITTHDFIETNGNGAVVFLIGLVPVVHALPTQYIAFGAYWLCVLVFLFLTNQFHKWAHQEKNSRLIVFLQRCHLILPPQHHGVHHEAPYDTHYCVTCGWLNPIIARLGFFEGIKWLVRRVMDRAQATANGRE